MLSARPRVAVVGAGVTGLTVAYRLGRSADAPEVVVLEADHRPGGKIRTIQVGGVPVEAGADSFVVRKPFAVDLCTELGLGDELVVPGASGAFVMTSRGLMPFPPRSAFGVPSRVRDLLGWKGLPATVRLRAALDLYRPARRRTDDEPLGRLLRRRLGERAARTMVEPLLGGLYAGDPDRLSTLATFPELAAWERRHGSLIRGARAAVRAAEGSVTGAMFATVWGGLDRLVEALASAIGSGRLRLEAGVVGMQREGPGYRLETQGGSVEADAVVLATPAFESARLVAEVNPDAARELAAVPYASTAVVILVYPEGTAGALPEGTGLVTTAGTGTITACTWVSRKWPSDDLGTRAVLRCFVGRAGSEAALDLSDDRLIEAARAEAERAVPMPAAPEAAEVVRWPRAMPQYEVGHLDLAGRIERALEATPGIFLAGSAYGGVGVPDCVRQAGEVAERVGAHLRAGGRPDRSGHERTNEREAIG
jgi:oxygen-dependent protoporphyrinogen oxidase